MFAWDIHSGSRPHSCPDRQVDISILFFFLNNEQLSAIHWQPSCAKVCLFSLNHLVSSGLLWKNLPWWYAYIFIGFECHIIVGVTRRKPYIMRPQIQSDPHLCCPCYVSVNFWLSIDKTLMSNWIETQCDLYFHWSEKLENSFDYKVAYSTLAGCHSAVNSAYDCRSLSQQIGS